MRIAAQLYTVRDFTTSREDFVETLQKLRKIGYREVQLSAVGCMNDGSVSGADCRQILEELQMKAPLTHRPWEEIKHRTEDCIEFHHTLGAELVAIGSIPGEYRAEGLDGYRRFVDDCEEPIEALEAAGLMFAYHNHAFEFEMLGPQKERPFDVMADHGSRRLKFEVDTFWVLHAGIYIESVFQTLEGRVPMVHLKDRTVSGNEPRMAPVGEGNIQWPELLKLMEDCGTVLGAVEQDDCYGRDPFECLRSSLDYLGR